MVLLWKQWCGLLKERWSTVKWLPKKKEGSISLWAFLLKRTAENWNCNLIHTAADFETWAQIFITELRPKHFGSHSKGMQEHWRDKQKYYLYFNRKMSFSCFPVLTRNLNDDSWVSLRLVHFAALFDICEMPAFYEYRSLAKNERTIH